MVVVRLVVIYGLLVVVVVLVGMGALVADGFTSHIANSTQSHRLVRLSQCKPVGQDCLRQCPLVHNKYASHVEAGA